MKLAFLILIIAGLIIILGSARNSSLSQMNAQPTQQEYVSSVITVPRYVPGSQSPNQDTAYLPMITWSEKKVSGEIIIHARPAEE
jgi:hypothetical protein